MCVRVRGVCVLRAPQLAAKGQRILALEVDVAAAQTATEKASVELAAVSAEKARLQVEAMTAANLRDSA